MNSISRSYEADAYDVKKKSCKYIGDRHCSNQKLIELRIPVNLQAHRYADRFAGKS